MKTSPVVAVLITFALMFATREAFSQVVSENKPSLPSAWRTELPSYGARSAEIGRDGAYVFVFDEGRLVRLRGEDGAMDWSEALVFLGLGGFVENRQITMLKSMPYFIICGDVVDTNGSYYTLMQLRHYPTGRVEREHLFPSTITGNIYVSDNDRYLAVTRNGRYTVMNTVTGDTIWSLPKYVPTSMATCWTRDSTRLLIAQAYDGGANYKLACWDIENNIELWNRAVPSGILTSTISLDGKRILFHAYPRNNSNDYVLLDYPSLKMVSSSTTSGMGSNCMLPSADANFIILTARHTKQGAKQNLALFDVKTETEQEIDSVSGDLSSEIIGGYFVRYGSRFVQKLRFDWATGVRDIEVTHAENTIVPNPCQGESTLEYFVGGAKRVRVSIYDSQGAVVAVLADGLQEGMQRLHVDCSTFSNGVYYCELVIGETKRSLLLQVTTNGGAK